MKTGVISSCAMCEQKIRKRGAGGPDDNDSPCGLGTTVKGIWRQVLVLKAHARRPAMVDKKKAMAQEYPVC